MAWMIVAAFCIVVGSITKNLYWQYYPYIKGVTVQPISIALYVIYLILCMTPLVVNWKEDAKWRSMKSKI